MTREATDEDCEKVMVWGTAAEGSILSPRLVMPGYTRGPMYRGTSNNLIARPHLTVCIFQQEGPQSRGRLGTRPRQAAHCAGDVSRSLTILGAGQDLQHYLCRGAQVVNEANSKLSSWSSMRVVDPFATAHMRTVSATCCSVVLLFGRHTVLS